MVASLVSAVLFTVFQKSRMRSIAAKPQDLS